MHHQDYPRSRVLSVRQPHAAAIFYAGKDVENRSWRVSWPTPFRLHIHASAQDDPAWKSSPMAQVLAEIQDEYRVQRGVLLGQVTVTEIIQDSKSPWALPGYWHWVLDDPRPLPRGPVPLSLSGQLGTWSMEQAIRALYEEKP